MIKYASLDINKIKNLLSEVQENIQALKEFSSLSFKDFSNDKKNYGLSEHHLRRALEGVLTIGTHILSRLPVKTKDYQEIILSLGKHKIVPEDFAEKNKKLASYRNRLVHMYWLVSEKEIHQIIREHLKDLEKFCQYYLKYIRKKS
ncbi:MAG: DUF86 domain-containing protein [Candidatus Nealsonbacteria bacterium CG02_land_8_20_14_3_00_37_10]|uniref:DUF86 domain-containing protein n=2 Tax=Candidatus Nealsoniibacteriota TaxID=1817911 RepID=A0A2G9Z0U1_9BACT|nr:MAG: hypothetical protein COX35_01240 [Candidatus Nealsonbacteria bacterium CG23_combo_of_CG06-09_8_20_14_all_37_18]PIV44866.1 MAG: DUF86 domain-containing protein [Candidatus Nealsonbacteria bacterium CG02_land_8_20_14_3_00_37_10]